jgi:hypothetical protein
MAISDKLYEQMDFNGWEHILLMQAVSKAHQCLVFTAVLNRQRTMVRGLMQEDNYFQGLNDSMLSKRYRLSEAPDKILGFAPPHAAELIFCSLMLTASTSICSSTSLPRPGWPRFRSSRSIIEGPEPFLQFRFAKRKIRSWTMRRCAGWAISVDGARSVEYLIPPCVAGVAQVVRAPDCDSGSRGFKSPHSPHSPSGFYLPGQCRPRRVPAAQTKQQPATMKPVPPIGASGIRIVVNACR